MKQDEPARLKDDGTEAQRTLLRSTPADMPVWLAEAVRARIESRMPGSAGTAGSRKVLRLVVAGGVLFAAGGAMAYGVSATRRLWPAAQSRTMVTAPRARQPAIEAPTTLVATSDEVVVRGDAVPKRRKPVSDAPAQRLVMVQPPLVAAAPPAPPVAPKISAPAFGLHDFREYVEPATAPANLEPSNPTKITPTRLGRLLVSWPSRRGASLDVLDMAGQGDAIARVFGTVNRTPLSIEIRRGLLVGKIGDEVVNIWLKGEDQASGSIAGYEVDFTVLPTHSGYLLRGNLPGHTARLEMRKGILRWYPGCENALAAVSPGVYQGTCAEGKNASVVLPPAFRKLPPLARLVMLAIVLTERDLVFRGRDPQIFNPTP